MIGQRREYLKSNPTQLEEIVNNINISININSNNSSTYQLCYIDYLVYLLDFNCQSKNKEEVKTREHGARDKDNDNTCDDGENQNKTFKLNV